MSIITDMSTLANSNAKLNQAVVAKIAQYCGKLIQGNFGFFSSTQSTHMLGRESYTDHKNTLTKNRKRVGNLTKGKLSKFITKAVVARLAAYKQIDLFSIPVVWKEISHVSMTEWREVSPFLKFAWYISAHMKTHGQRYCAFTLNIGKGLLGSEDWSNKTPAEINALKNKMRERLKTAIPEEPYPRLFAIELDDAGRPHIHGIVFGCTCKQLEQYRPAIKRAGGRWSGNNVKHQLVIKGRHNFDDAMGWISYSTKDCNDYVYVPQDIRDNGKAHYLTTKQKIEAIRSNNHGMPQKAVQDVSAGPIDGNLDTPLNHLDRDSHQPDVQPPVTAPAESKVLEKNGAQQSNAENIRHPNLKPTSEPTRALLGDCSDYGSSWGVFC